MSTLIIGGGGKTGRLVATKLSARGLPVRPVSRGTSPRFDWYDNATWPAAVDGSTAAYVTFQPDIGLPGADAIIGSFARTAVSRGCTRLVLLSGRGEESARRAEQALAASGADWTVVRSAFFVQNFTEGIWADELAHGSLTMLEHSATEPFIDTDDIADVAVAALTQPGHSSAVYEVTGPRLLTFREVVAAIARISDREIDYRELPTDAFTAALRDAGLPPEDAGGLAAMFGEVLDGRNAHVTDTVHQVLDRTPHDPIAVLADPGRPTPPQP